MSEPENSNQADELPAKSDEEQSSAPNKLSPNPATNALIAGVLLSAIGKISRETVETAFGVSKKVGDDDAEDAPPKPSMVHALAAAGAAKLATKSLPGFAIVSTGLLAKTLFDRSQTRRKERQKALKDAAKVEEKDGSS